MNHRDEFDNIVFEVGITGIRTFVFDKNISVKLIKFPSTQKRIDDDVFCIYILVNLIFPDNLEYLGNIPEIEGLFVNRGTIPAKLNDMGIGDNDKEEIVLELLNKHNCQVIINGLMSTIKYYLRLISD